MGLSKTDSIFAGSPDNDAEMEAGLLFKDKNGCSLRRNSVVTANQPPVLLGGTSLRIVQVRY